MKPGLSSSPHAMNKWKLYIADARPRKNALANGAMGGGSESSANYSQSEITMWILMVPTHLMLSLVEQPYSCVMGYWCNCVYSCIGENESKAVLDAFFLGKALGEALNESLESVVGEFLSIVGQFQSEQQKQLLNSRVQLEPEFTSRLKPKESKLEARVAKFISLICNVSVMRQHMMEIGVYLLYQVYLSYLVT
ncbi:hypothetical protein CASFOL_042849 [Castilleja foliolosa]|uniref:Myotubularin phosphatase domain-containing protein n=1 Tax=Castilleja foliolosa TaxID=1961234 RepID=A0ABD3B831_9LAMI